MRGAPWGIVARIALIREDCIGRSAAPSTRRPASARTRAAEYRVHRLLETSHAT